MSVKYLYFAAAGAIGGTVGDCLTEPLLWNGDSVDLLLMTVRVGSWFAAVSSLMATCILAAEGFYMRRRVLEARILIGSLSGFAVGMASGALGQAIFEIFGYGEPLRVVCWGISGGLLGLALGMQITNMRAWRGLLGGLAGGCVGGLAFVLVTQAVGDLGGRIAGVGLIGGAIGAFLALSERLSLVAWLAIRLRDGQRRQVSLGPTRVTIGTNEARCTVVIPRAAQVSYAFRLNGHDVVCEDVTQRTTRLLQWGEIFRIGGATVQVQGNRRARLPAAKPVSAATKPEKPHAKAPTKIPPPTAPRGSGRPR